MAYSGRNTKYNFTEIVGYKEESGYYFINASSHKFMSLGSGSISLGANVQCSTLNQQNNDLCIWKIGAQDETTGECMIFPQNGNFGYALTVSGNNIDLFYNYTDISLSQQKFKIFRINVFPMVIKKLTIN